MLYRRLILTTAALLSLHAVTVRAASETEIQVLRDELQQTKTAYETRLKALEDRNGGATDTRTSTANTFNPAIALILSGTYANLSQSPSAYAISGFIPSGGDVAPPHRGFDLGESELTFNANIDPYVYGQLIVSLAADNTAAVEEAWIQTLDFSPGLTAKAGRFFSGIGYINERHSHVWDFVDMPLAQKALLGNQYAAQGVQLKWLIPSDLFIEVGAEVGSGKNFPGAERDKNGVGGWALFAHTGGDFTVSHNWRAGLSCLSHEVTDRSYNENTITNTFNGDSQLWIADFVWKWAPNGNKLQTNFKLQAEYYRRDESGLLSYNTTGATQIDNYSSAQAGWYLQGIYQFMPHWRVGLRLDRLDSGTVNTGSIDINNLPILRAYSPSRQSLMVDYSPSEFSRFRLQLARDKANRDLVGNEVMLQYIVSLGSHGAHQY